jgi:hypothetical protein
MAHRLDPPCVDAGEEPRVRREVGVYRRLIDDLAARDVDEDRITLHQRQFTLAEIG